MSSNREEAIVSYPMEGNRKVTFIIRDKLAPDDVIVNRTMAKLLALRVEQALDTVPVHRNIKDLLIKLNTTV